MLCCLYGEIKMYSLIGSNLCWIKNCKGDELPRNGLCLNLLFDSQRVSLIASRCGLRSANEQIRIARTFDKATRRKSCKSRSAHARVGRRHALANRRARGTDTAFGPRAASAPTTYVSVSRPAGSGHSDDQDDDDDDDDDDDADSAFVRAVDNLDTAVIATSRISPGDRRRITDGSDEASAAGRPSLDTAGRRGADHF